MRRRSKTPEQIEETRRRIMRICLTTALGCAVIGIVFRLTANYTLREMSLFLFGWAAGCVAAYLNTRVQRLVQRARRSDNS
jgi:predicted membrane channel-forming protein YqfA (hemolysin III family)